MKFMILISEAAYEDIREGFKWYEKFRISYWEVIFGLASCASKDVFLFFPFLSSLNELLRDIIWTVIAKEALAGLTQSHVGRRW